MPQSKKKKWNTLASMSKKKTRRKRRSRRKGSKQKKTSSRRRPIGSKKNKSTSRQTKMTVVANIRAGEKHRDLRYIRAMRIINAEEKKRQSERAVAVTSKPSSSSLNDCSNFSHKNIIDHLYETRMKIYLGKNPELNEFSIQKSIDSMFTVDDIGAECIQESYTDQKKRNDMQNVIEFRDSLNICSSKSMELQKDCRDRAILKFGKHYDLLSDEEAMQEYACNTTSDLDYLLIKQLEKDENVIDFITDEFIGIFEEHLRTSCLPVTNKENLKAYIQNLKDKKLTCNVECLKRSINDVTRIVNDAREELVLNNQDKVDCDDSENVEKIIRNEILRYILLNQGKSIESRIEALTILKRDIFKTRCLSSFKDDDDRINATDLLNQLLDNLDTKLSEFLSLDDGISKADDLFNELKESL